MIKNKIYQGALLKELEWIEVDAKSFLITGASGLIGSCLVDLLMLANIHGKRNHVYALGRNKEKLERRFMEFVGNEYFHIFEHDICQPLSDEIDVDYVIHGASNADPVAYAKYPAETMNIIVNGSYNVLEYGKTHKHCKIVMLSTFEVYGNTGKELFFETDAGIIDFNSLRACYPESKRTMEIMTRCYVDEYDVNVNVARLCSIYGPTMTVSDSKAHAQFLRNSLRGENIVLKSKGEQRRTYCYVVDAVTGILAVLFRGKKGDCYNVSNEKTVVSIAEVARTIADISGTHVVYDMPSEIEAKGFSKPQNCILDNSKLCKLGWSSRYTLKESLEQTLEILKSVQ